MITLQSSDGTEFVVEEIIAMESLMLCHLIEAGCADSSIPLPNVSAKILSKVIEYCRNHVEMASKKVDEDLNNWDKEFFGVDQATLFGITLAANYLNIKRLLDLACKTVADRIKGKTVEEIRETFHIKNDFTPQEEEEIRHENQWAFE